MGHPDMGILDDIGDIIAHERSVPNISIEDAPYNHQKKNYQQRPTGGKQRRPAAF